MAKPDHIAVDPRNANIVYGGEYQGQITRYDKGTGQAKEIGVYPVVQDAMGAAVQEHRFQWTAPIMISPHDPNVVYHAGEKLFKSIGRRQSLGSHLARPDPQRQDQAADFRRPHHQGRHRHRVLRHNLCHRGISAAGKDDLGRQRRWPAPYHSRRGKELDQHHSKRYAGVGNRQPHRAFPLRSPPPPMWR